MSQSVGSGGVIALCGGVGGAKLARGLTLAMNPASLTVVVNTGDDFEHLGLTICPDIDTVLYTLAGLNDRERGWGLEDETWTFMAAIEALGGDTWFRLGDKDLATHVCRSNALGQGQTLSDVTASLARSMGITATILPMSDDAVRTMVQTEAGELPFQRYFVEQRCEPRVTSVRFDGAAAAQLSEGVRNALSAQPQAIVICPSNPYLSVDPLLALPDLRRLLEVADAPVVAVSPIVDGGAVKGPTAKIMRELGLAVNSLTIAEHYHGLIDGLVIDTSDAALAAEIEATGIRVNITATLMRNDNDRKRVASEVLDFVGDIRRTTSG